MLWNLSSGLLSRSFCSAGGQAWTCNISTSIASESLPSNGELLQRVAPEATMRVNNTRVWVGGLDAPPAGAIAMTFVGLVENSSHTAERYKWFPGERQTDPRTAWPPKGATATLLFCPPGATNSQHSRAIDRIQRSLCHKRVMYPALVMPCIHHTNLIQ
eukprot:SAG31_NODE_5648_length_2404_cov_2.372234_3_plen_158_part_01